MGAIDGVTTNPTLLARTGQRLEEAISAICEIVHGPVSAEVLATDAAGMLAEGRALSRLHPNVVVKIPLIVEGLKAVRVLSGEKIPTNVTLCFSPNQALLAAKAGASYVSPFVGRLDDLSDEGMGLIEKILTIYRNYSFQTEVLVASVRHPVHVMQAALLGAQVCTVPFKVITQLAAHPLTERGLDVFLKDAAGSAAPRGQK